MTRPVYRSDPRTIDAPVHQQGMVCTTTPSSKLQFGNFRGGWILKTPRNSTSCPWPKKVGPAPRLKYKLSKWHRLKCATRGPQNTSRTQLASEKRPPQDHKTQVAHHINRPRSTLDILSDPHKRSSQGQPSKKHHGRNK